MLGAVVSIQSGVTQADLANKMADVQARLTRLQQAQQQRQTGVQITLRNTEQLNEMTSSFSKSMAHADQTYSENWALEAQAIAELSRAG